MQSSQRLVLVIVFAIFILVLGLLTSWLLTHAERVTEIQETGYQGEARYNPLLAAQRLLQSMQIKVKALHQLPEISHSLKSQDVLLLIQGHQDLPIQQREKLLHWVATGGHLILVSNHLTDGVLEEEEERQSILTVLGIQQQRQGLSDEAIRSAAPLDIQLPFATTLLQVEFQADYTLHTEQPSQWQGADAYGIHALHRAYQQGAITVLSDAWFLHNARIGQQDHAVFFWHLLHQQHQPQRVWLVYPLQSALQDADSIRRKPSQTANCEQCTGDDRQASQVPGLWERLWQHAWFVVISIGVLLLLLIWYSSRRFGALLPPPSAPRRRLQEHIEASAEFFWRHQQSKQLLRGLRQHILQEIQLRHPDLHRLPRETQLQHLSQRCQLSAEQLNLALYHMQIDSRTDFLEAVQSLQQLRNHL